MFLARKEEELEALMYHHLILFSIIASIACLAIAIYGVQPRGRHEPVREPIASLVCVPTVLDAIFGGNRRERVLRGERYPLFMSLT